MLRSTVVAGLLLLLGSPPLLADDPAAPMTSRPIQIISCASLSDELSDVKPMGFRPGFQIFYLIEGQDIARLNSVAIDSILTAEGKEISKFRNGQPAYQKGPFGNVSRDGRHCVFSLEVDNNQFGKAESVKVKGHAVVLVGTKQEQHEIVLLEGDREEKKLGPFTCKVGKGRGPGIFPVFQQLLPGLLGKPGTPDSAGNCPTPAEKTEAAVVPTPPAGKPISGTITPLPAKPTSGYITEVRGTITEASGSADGDGEGLNVTITGPEKSLISLQLLDGDADMQQGYMTQDDRRVYDVNKPKSGKITCKISYWTDLKEAKVPIGAQDAGKK